MKPRVFIGSSLEAKRICDGIQSSLNYSAWPSAWHQIFPLSSVTVQALLEQCAKSDFAVLVFSPE